MWNQAIKVQINDKLLTIKTNYPIVESLKGAMAYGNVIERANRCWVFLRTKEARLWAECF